MLDAVGRNRFDRLDVAEILFRRVRSKPAPSRSEPQRHREVMQRHKGPQSAGARTLDHAAVVVDCGSREESLDGFDTGPFDAESVVGKSGACRQIHVLAPPVKGVDGVARGLFDEGAGLVFDCPPVRREIVALGLVSARPRPTRRRTRR